MISVAAELAGMHAQTLRQYDRLGLVSPGRTPGGGRRYSPRDVALLREVQRLSQEDGVNLAGIKRIIELESQVEALQARVHELLEELERGRARRMAAEAAVPPRYRPDLVPQRRPSNALVVWRRGPTGERPARRRTRRSCGWSGRSACCCAARGPSPPGWPGELHPELDGAAYGLLALLQDAGPLRASDLVIRLGPGQEHGQPPGGPPGRPRPRRPPADPDDGRAQVLTPSAEGSARLARIRDARRARWEDDLGHWPAADVATLASCCPAQPASARPARPRQERLHPAAPTCGACRWRVNRCRHQPIRVWLGLQESDRARFPSCP